MSKYKKYNAPLKKLLIKNNTDKKADQKSSEEYGVAIFNCLIAHKIEVTPIACKISPVNIVYDFRLSPNCQFKTVKNLEQDISLAVGLDVKVFSRNDEDHVFSISVPRGIRSYVSLGEIISSEEYKAVKSPLTIGVGIDETAKNVVFDLAQAPHLLISGTTGAGKTVFLDDIILSIIYKSSPKSVSLILIDPSIKDFAAYENLPHLMFPVASDKWMIYEVVKYARNRMDERFKRLAKAGHRNIENYNEGKKKGRLNRIVIIIDKYMELTYEMPSDFEECLSEIARKGRAAGIHLVINTQSARSEVISNNIKSNMPYRAAFSVTDWHESKAILDRTGAQKLLGNGDMLFAPGFDNTPKHLQTANVTLEEVESVVKNTIDRNGRANYINDFHDLRESLEFDDADVINILELLSVRHDIDVDVLQQLMAVNYAEATDIMDFLEENGVVSEYNGSKKRTINQVVVEDMTKAYSGESLDASEEEDN